MLPTFSVTTAGTFSVKVDLNDCAAYDTIVVTCTRKPSINLVKDTSICVTEKLLLNAFFPTATYLWQDGSAQSQYTVTQPGIYKVQVTNGCVIVSSITTVKYENCSCKFFVPGAFTPDNNGKNDIFKPTYQCLFTDYSLKIFNRFGQLVFNTASPNAGWDGMFNNQKQPMGAYFWLLQYNDRLGRKSSMQKGTVLLIR